MKDDPLKLCPKCSKELRRLINGGNGVIFKGNGFYVTDKNAKSGKDEKKGEPAKAAPEKSAGKESTPCAGCAKSETCPKSAS